MGAPIRSWVFRVVLSLVSMYLVFAVSSAPWPIWQRVLLLALIVLAAAHQMFLRLPAFDPGLRLRWRLPSVGGGARCALTFDDGPSPWTPAVLDILAAEGVPATFFVLGVNVARHPGIVRRAQDEGHAIGLHGMDHRKLSGASAATIEQQLSGVTSELERAGVLPAPVYRTPHGFKSRGVFEIARRRGLTLWAWSRGIWDTDRPDPAVLVRRATRFARSGMVLLLHDGRGEEARPDVRPMLEALPAIIRELKRRGFDFVRVGDV